MRNRITLAIICALGLFGDALRADDWPQWLGPQRDGVWRETSIVEQFPKGGPPDRWRVAIAQARPYDRAFRFASPAGPDGRDWLNMRLLLDDQEIAKSITFHTKEEAGKFEHALASITLPAGVHVLKIADNWGVDSVRFAKASSQTSKENKR